MGRRIALVVNAMSGEELSGGRADAAKVFSLLCDDELGACDPNGPSPVQDCASREQFHDALMPLLQKWSRKDQLLLYFSGHGVVKNNQYTLVFGPEDARTFLPFESIKADLQAHGVDRAIVILDACHSGAALKQGEKAVQAEQARPHIEQELPQGMAMLASCRDYQSSFELTDGSGSVFTHLMAEGIKSGLGGSATNDGLIGPEDIIRYINARLQEPEFTNYRQTPAFGVYSADRQVWLAKNKTTHEPEPSPLPAQGARSIQELQHLYEITEPTRRPCAGSAVAHLDWALIEDFARQTSSVNLNEDHETVSRELGLYSVLDDASLHVAAVLCFGREPHRFCPQARATFTVGKKTSSVFKRTDVLGPLSRQANQLRDLVQREIQRHYRRTDYDATQEMFFNVVREAISNAITHRNYQRSELVRVAVEYPVVEIYSPGGFPAGCTWETLIRAEDHLSAPHDAAVAWYLTPLNAFEGLGRGFEVFETFLRLTDESYLSCRESDGLEFVKITARFPAVRADERASHTIAASAPPAPAAAPPDDEITRLAAPMAASPKPPIPDATPPVAHFGHYRVKRLLGQGGAGQVYLATDERLQRDVAIKVLSMRFDSRELQERFRIEAMISAKLSHPGIVQIYDVGLEGDLSYLVMQYVRGSNLQAFLRENAEVEFQASATTYFHKVAVLTAAIADALMHAHSHDVVHRDIKPANILLTEDGKPMIADFGISRDARFTKDATALTVEGSIMGTPAYMSPEQAEGADTDHRTDIYALGTVLYELLTGEPPFRGDSIGDILRKKLTQAPPEAATVRAVPRTLAAVCTAALQRDPEDRYANAGAMAAELWAFLEGAAPRSSSSGSLLGRLTKWLRPGG